MSALIIGISGVTNGGKSSLSKNLFKVLPLGTKLIMQDDFFYPENSTFHIPCPGGIKHHNWDVISSVDMNRMVNDVKLIVDDLNGVQGLPKSVGELGTPRLGFQCEGLGALEGVDSAFYGKVIEGLIKDMGNRRRIVLLDGFCMFDDPRIRQMCDLQLFLTLDKETCFQRRQTRTYDPPDPPNYFEYCIWPMYIEHLERVKQIPNIHFYDGRNNIPDIFVEVLKKIASL